MSWERVVGSGGANRGRHVGLDLSEREGVVVDAQVRDRGRAAVAVDVDPVGRGQQGPGP